jgi:ATP/ADP translocase
VLVSIFVSSKWVLEMRFLLEKFWNIHILVFLFWKRFGDLPIDELKRGL